jgi:hypothetical protein
MLVLLLTGWTGARAMWWENPFPPAGLAAHAAHAAPARPPVHRAGGLAAEPRPAPGAALPAMPFAAVPLHAAARRAQAFGTDPRLAAAHQLLWLAAHRTPLRPAAGADLAGAAALSGPDPRPAVPPFLPAPLPAAAGSGAAGGRWSLDAWAFWREGSNAAPISEGRVPIYGASQAGAVLHYRLAPGARRDPRLHVRAYRALVRRGEQELALGAGLRPLPRVPLRVAGELRYTDGAFGDAWRPAAFAVTEIPPLPLPYGTRLEAYGQAGWVGGAAPTGFAEGQASLTREVPQLAALTGNALHLSLGAAAWGGAQEDAQRIDIGPTLRLDLTVGAVPARFTLDWRERVGGRAGPDSGVAATLSTQF